MADRRSTYPKTFVAGQLDAAVLTQLFEVARWAPTHKLTQPWRFVAFAGAAKTRLAMTQSSLAADEARGAAIFANTEASAAVVAVVMRREVEPRVPEWEDVCATACAVQNVLLAAPSLGLVGYWSSGAGTGNAKVAELIGLADTDHHFGWLFLGFPGDAKREAPARREVSAYLEIKL